MKQGVEGVRVDQRQGRRLRPHHLYFWYPAPGEILDISREGMRVRICGVLRTGERSTFRLRYRSHVVEVNAITKWIERMPRERTGGGDYSTAGLRFASKLDFVALAEIASTLPVPPGI